MEINKKIVLIALALLAVCMVAITLISIFYEMRHPHSNDYAVVFDAGSSGTRMYIYKWKAGYSAAKGDELVVEQHSYCENDDNGIDKFRSESEVIEKLTKCLTDAEKKIPTERYHRTHVFLAATAGMRLLKIKNKTQAHQIINHVRNIFKKSPFLYRNESQVRIITGQEEGIDAWISVNYFEKNFHPNPSPEKTIGTLGNFYNWNDLFFMFFVLQIHPDLGGASTQIVFVPKNDSSKQVTSKNIYNIRIYGVDYTPYSQSYLCWGMNEFNRMYQDYNVRKQRFATNVKISCFPSNTNWNESSRNIFNSFCTYSKDSANITSQYYFSGTSNATSCRREVRDLVSKKSCENGKEACLLNDPDQPKLKQNKFMAFSAYFYGSTNAYNLFNLTFEEDIVKFSNLTDRICSMSLNKLMELNRKNNASISKKYLETLCLTNVYMLELLNSFGFTDLSNVKIANTINGYNIGWTLGYLINELNRDDFLPFEYPPRKLEFKYFLPFIILAGVLIIAILAFLVVYFHKSFKYSAVNTNTSDS